MVNFPDASTVKVDPGNAALKSSIAVGPAKYPGLAPVVVILKLSATNL